MNTYSFPTDTSRSPSRRARRATASPVREAVHQSPAARLFVRMIGAWALATGRSVSVDALGVVALVKTGLGEPLRHWTAGAVESFLWRDVMAWARANDLSPPDDIAETLWVVFDFLVATDGFEPGSDSLPALRLPLVTTGGLDAYGLRRGSRAGTRSRAPRRSA
jgi:hypothetical protein